MMEAKKLPLNERKPILETHPSSSSTSILHGSWNVPNPKECTIYFIIKFDPPKKQNRSHLITPVLLFHPFLPNICKFPVLDTHIHACRICAAHGTIDTCTDRGHHLFHICWSSPSALRLARKSPRDRNLEKLSRNWTQTSSYLWWNRFKSPLKHIYL